MGIPVKLQAFEGPLDLLLHLIDKNKVNIYDIPIVEITNQYLSYIQMMKEQDLNVMSEFLVMAATLLDIKSKMLLPKEVNEEGEEEDPRQELVEKLLEYKLYKYMSYELREKQQEASFAMYKPATIPPEVEAYRPEVNTEELLKGITLSQMNQIFKGVMKRQNDRIDPIRSTFGTLEKEEVDMDATWDQVERYIMAHPSCRFRDVLENQKAKMQIVIAFLVVLELMKIGKIKIVQEDTFSEILITAVEKEEPDGN